jgi:hypothetical protein
VDLAGGLNEVLEMRASKEIAEVDEFAMVLVFDIDHTPAVLASANLLSTNNDGLLATNNGEGNDVLLIHVRKYISPIQSAMAIIIP